MVAIIIGFFVLACSLQSTVVTSSLVCGPGRRVDLLLSCQETCEHKKPLICLPMPRCICLYGKMWDEQVSKCVSPWECIYKGQKRAWAETGDGNGMTENVGNNTYRATLSNAAGLIFGDGTLSLSTVLRRILSIPMIIPRNLVKQIQNLIDGLVNLDVSTIRTAIETILNAMANQFQNILQETLRVLTRVVYMKAELIVGILRGIKDFVNWAVNNLASLGINISEVFNNVIGFLQNQATAIIDGTIQLIGWFAKAIGRILSGSFSFVDIEELFNIPPIRNILAFITAFANHAFRDLSTFLEHVTQFIKGIADFFSPSAIITTRDATGLVDSGDIIAKQNVLTTDITDEPTQIIGWIAKTFSKVLNGSFSLEDIIDLVNLPPVRNTLAIIKPFADRIFEYLIKILENSSELFRNILGLFERPFFTTNRATSDGPIINREGDFYYEPKFSLANLRNFRSTYPN